MSLRTIIQLIKIAPYCVAAYKQSAPRGCQSIYTSKNPYLVAMSSRS